VGEANFVGEGRFATDFDVCDRRADEQSTQMMGGDLVGEPL
jgi:hypothetical protein